MMKNIQVYNFVEWELQKFRDECNFTDEELQCFELKAKDKSIEYIAQQMHISTAKTSRLIKRVKKQKGSIFMLPFNYRCYNGYKNYK